MSDAFERILPFTLHWEGGYSNDPADPGGRTQYGISERYEPEAWADGKVDLAEAAAVYRAHYWTPAGCDRFADPVAMVLFECAVNPGLDRAFRFLQAALGVAADGHVGVLTILASKSADPREVALRMVDCRSGYWIARAVDSPKIKFLDGWMNRSAALRAELQRG